MYSQNLEKDTLRRRHLIKKEDESKLEILANMRKSHWMDCLMNTTLLIHTLVSEAGPAACLDEDYFFQNQKLSKVMECLKIMWNESDKKMLQILQSMVGTMKLKLERLRQHSGVCPMIKRRMKDSKACLS